MKKLVLSSLALSAGLIAVQASAVTVPTTGGTVNWSGAGMSAALTTYITGSSAATPFLENALRQKQCTSGTPIYKFNAGSGASFVYVCESTLAGNPIIIVHKRDGGGSINGIRSALALTATQWVATPVTGGACTAGAAPIQNCPGAVLAAAATNPRAELALSDVEGDKLGIRGTTYSPVATQVFGVVVNTILRNAMQTAQIAKGLLPGCAVGSEAEGCMPNLTRAQLSSIFANPGVEDWGNLALTPLLTTADPASDYFAAPNSPVNICGRTFGSGTWATANIKLENSPCFGINEAINTPTSPITAANSKNTITAGGKVYWAMSGSGDVESCLSGLNNGNSVGNFTGNTDVRFAIGVMGVERNASGSLPYRFIKIDGAAPSNQNVVEGRYDMWAQLGSVTGPGLPNVTDALAVSLLAQMKDPNQIRFLNVFQTWRTSATDTRANTGFLGEAVNSNPAFSSTQFDAATPGDPNIINSGFDVTRPVNPYSHAKTGQPGGQPNHCSLPTIPQGRVMPVFYD